MEKKSFSLSVIIGVIVLAFAMSAATFLLPTDAANSVASHWRAAIATAPMFLFVGAGIILWRGLKTFKTEVRKAYRLLAIGLLAFSALLGQLVYWGITDTWDSAWATSGSGLVPYVFAGAVTYLGARKFAKLLEVKSLLNSFWFTFVITLVGSLVMGGLATAFVAYELEAVETYIAVCSWGALFLTCATILMYKTSRVIGDYYRDAVKWLSIGVGTFAAASWQEAINTFWFNNGTTYTDYGYYLLPWIAAGLVLLYAAYKFRQLADVGSEVLASTQAPTDRDYIDSFVAVAGLASRPREIGHSTDTLGMITAKLGGRALNASEKQRIEDAFHQLEDYLMHKDPVRTFTKEEILSQATPAFRKVVA